MHMTTHSTTHSTTREKNRSEMTSAEILSRTRSLCPQCLRPVESRRVRQENDVYLVKECPEHGACRTIIWRGEPAMESWTRPKTPSTPGAPFTARERGCPFDCGLCPEHAQHTCSALVEVTSRCDLGCPICFADAEGQSPDPDHETIGAWLDGVMRASGDCVIQLSGGEPTVRDDLPRIVALTKAKGFSFVQINTNGLRLAQDEAYFAALAEAGVNSLYLQFDGVSDAVYEAIRGRPLLDIKKRVVERADRYGVGVVLVATVVPGINPGELGALLRYGAQAGPVVRGVHFQPVSYFGRYPHPPADADRITLPEIMRGLEAQTDGMVRAGDFTPPGCEHALCSFHATYLRQEEGRLQLRGNSGQCCATKDKNIPTAEQGAIAATAFTKRQWTAPACGCESDDTAAGAPLGELDAFLENNRRNSFTVSAMAFQDAWTIDLERVQGCCIHCVAPDGRLVPFCAYNLTTVEGRALHRDAGARP